MTHDNPMCPRCGNERTHAAGDSRAELFTCERCFTLFGREESMVRVHIRDLAKKIAAANLYELHDPTEIVEPEKIIDERLTVDDLLYEVVGYYS